MITFKASENEKDWHDIREAVFVKEQGFHDEFDEIDQIATHITVYVDGLIAGCIRYFQEEESYRIGRLAVLPKYRTLHLGSALVQQVEQQLKLKQEHVQIYLDAQCRVVPFYEKLGYVICGEEHMDEHVPHVQMSKEL